MSIKKKFLGVIPARKGSKGIKNKNLILLDNKPLIQYTLEAAEKSRLLDLTIVTTDDPGVIELSKEFNVNVPFRRPGHLATDTASSLDVVLHALDHLETNEGYMPEFVVLLQPTCPLRDEHDIDSSIEQYLEESKAYGTESLISVNVPSEHPFDCICIDGHDMELAFEKSEKCCGRQGFSQFYFMNGAVYITPVNTLRKKGLFFDKKQKNSFYVMHQSHSIDIDEIFDLKVAESLLQTGNVIRNMEGME
ncbi:acylneuraminate cytidylyltransferase family protein [uncultured Methanolobus sp.]|uniref:acylneuraminate cytidylyltransferase family protein n=1 Tax=uncultured Methanolobus sp. TaxID=218300 RepID=UPI0029C63092|nr:acylneuraminate cytidylyltransferase family protein [uncultured Methanolobus sp.]